MKTLRLLLAAVALLAACDAPQLVTPPDSPRRNTMLSPDSLSGPERSPQDAVCDTTCSRFPQTGGTGG